MDNSCTTRPMSLPTADVQDILSSHFLSGFVSHLEEDLFWLQRSPSSASSLDVSPKENFVKGEIVIGLWEGNWYRAQVLEEANEERMLKLLFVDWGNAEYLSKDFVRKSDSQHRVLPPLVVKCKIKGSIDEFHSELESSGFRTKIKCSSFENGYFIAEKYKSSNLAILEDLKSMQDNMVEQRKKIESALEAMVGNNRKRAEMRKEILLREMKSFLVTLSNKDKDVTQDIKADVFDLLLVIDELTEKAGRIHSDISNKEKITDETHSILRDFDHLKESLLSLKLNSYLKHFDISVALNEETKSVGLDRIADSLFLSSSVINSKLYSLELHDEVLLDEHPDKFFSLRLHCADKEGKLQCDFTSFVLKRIQLVVGTLDQDLPHLCLNTKVEDCNLFLKVGKSQAFFVENGPRGRCLQILCKRPPGAKVYVSVKILDFHVLNSPLVTHGLPNTSSAQSFSVTAVNFNKSELKALDYSSFAVMDKSMKTWDPFGGVDTPAQPSARSCVLRRETRHFNTSTPFSPLREGLVSTLRQPLPRMTDKTESARNNPVNVSLANDSILAPSKTGTVLDIETVQKSLSSDDSEGGIIFPMGDTGGSTLGPLDKSVTFSQHTEICQYLATPQVKKDGARFKLAEGITKSKDGSASFHKKLLAAQNALQTTPVNGETEGA